MNRLDPVRRAQVVRCLVEGNSIRSTVRMTGVAKNTVVKLLVELGAACSEYQDQAMHNLPCQRIQCDEIWAFVGCKQKDVTAKEAEAGICGDVWTWTALDAETKLIPCWLIGQRDVIAARDFIEDLTGRLANRVQLTTDGHKPYLTAVDKAFGEEIDYAQLVKIYGNDPEGQKRYSPAQCIGTRTHAVTGEPDPKHISTSFVERSNLSIRMGTRRFTRLTNAFSKTVENHAAAVALFFMYYNFGRKHQTLGTTPAVKAGIADHIWSIDEIVALADSNWPSTPRSDQYLTATSRSGNRWISSITAAGRRLPANPFGSRRAQISASKSSSVAYRCAGYRCRGSVVFPPHRSSAHLSNALSLYPG